jgi:hypothetical protein
MNVPFLQHQLLNTAKSGRAIDLIELIHEGADKDATDSVRNARDSWCFCFCVSLDWYGVVG